ncbi:MAG: DNA double-strand break repair nuclease NurA [Candidatus Micrarchaeota archaeon]
MPIDDSIVKLARSWLEAQSKLAQAAQDIKKALPQSREFLETPLIQKMSPQSPSGSFCAIDGGIACEEFHGLDVAAVRSVASCFSYENQKLSSCKYFPSSRPPLEISAISAAGQYEKMRFLSLTRLKSELECAIGSLEKFSPSYLLLDGSIAPLMEDKPPQDSQLTPLYDELILLYTNLYAQCSKKHCTLAGITKDSRARRLVEIICDSSPQAQSPLSSCLDTVFLDHLLCEGERTCAFRYSASPAKNPVLKDLGDHSQNIMAFYIKPMEHDRPLRIEFLSNGQQFSQIADTLSSISSINRNYAYPAILIEADLRAALEQNEVEAQMETLASHIGKKRPLLKLRRNTRPFR